MRSFVAFLFAMPVAFAAAACSFDDKHEKYPEPNDPGRPVVQSGRDPASSASHQVPGWDLTAPATSADAHFTAKTFYAGPRLGNQPRAATSSQ
jgi:hypothetical protein